MSDGITRRAALIGTGGVVAAATIGQRADGQERHGQERPHERLHRALREMRDAMEYIRETPAGTFQEHHKRRALEALEVAIRQVEEMMREHR